jgi:glycosyltransferase involved in cell wall biosynthesis
MSDPFARTNPSSNSSPNPNWNPTSTSTLASASASTPMAARRQPSLLSINNYHYPRGGADAMYLAHGARFEAMGWQHAWFSMQHPRNLPTPWSSHFVDDIEFGHRYTPLELARKAGASIWSLQAQRRLRSVLAASRPDVVHLHNIYHHLSPSILPVLQQAGVPTVMTAHDFKIACPNYRMHTQGGVCERCRDGSAWNALARRCVRDSFKASALVALEATVHRTLRSWHRWPDRIVSPSRFLIEKCAQWGFDRSRFVHIPNPIDAQGMQAQPQPGDRFVYIGRLSSEKGLDRLIAAVRLARVSLVIAGEGPLAPLVSAAVRDLPEQVQWVGRLDAAQVQALVRSARAVVVPSQWYENAPLSVLEAFAAGKPVLASRIGGLPEMVEHGRTGWLVPADDTDALGEMLAAVRGLPDARVESVGRAARDFVVREHSWAGYLHRMQALYAQLGVPCAHTHAPARPM